MSRRALMAAAIVVTVLVGAGGVLYAFGTPQAPQPTAPAAQSPQPAEPADEVSAGLPATETSGEETVEPVVPAPDPSVPLAIEIPGCVCHSDDPEIVEEHAAYRMNQCAGCHAGAVPTGQ